LKRRESSVLAVGSSSGSGATTEQFVETCKMSHITVVFAEEIEAL
jgi:hypothetical protein